MGPSLPGVPELVDRLGPLLWRVGTPVAVLLLLAEIPDVHPEAAAKYLAGALLGALAGLYSAWGWAQAGGPWLPTACYALGATLPLALRGVVGRGIANALGAVALAAGWLTMPT